MASVMRLVEALSFNLAMEGRIVTGVFFEIPQRNP